MHNGKLNLVELLGNCPKGTKLYSPLFGEVTLERIDCDSHPIVVLDGRSIMRTFNHWGEYMNDYPDSEVLLFPSKDQRDWNEFNFYRDGDFLSTENDKAFIFKCYNSKGYPSAHCGLDYDGNFINYDNISMTWTYNSIRKATKDEIEILLRRIAEAGYVWDFSNKMLRKKLPIGSLVLASNHPVDNVTFDRFELRKYAGNYQCFFSDNQTTSKYNIIVPLDKIKMYHNDFIYFNKEDNYGIGK